MSNTMRCTEVNQGTGGKPICTKPDGTKMEFDPASTAVRIVPPDAKKQVPGTTVSQCAPRDNNRLACTTGEGAAVEVVTNAQGDVLYLDQKDPATTQWTRMCTQKGYAATTASLFRAGKPVAGDYTPDCKSPVAVAFAPGERALIQKALAQKAGQAKIDFNSAVDILKVAGGRDHKNFTLEKTGAGFTLSRKNNKKGLLMTVVPSKEGVAVKITQGETIREFTLTGSHAKTLLDMMTAMSRNGGKMPSPAPRCTPIFSFFGRC